MKTPRKRDSEEDSEEDSGLEKTHQAFKGVDGVVFDHEAFEPAFRGAYRCERRMMFTAECKERCLQRQAKRAKHAAHAAHAAEGGSASNP